MRGPSPLAAVNERSSPAILPSAPVNAATSFSNSASFTPEPVIASAIGPASTAERTAPACGSSSRAARPDFRSASVNVRPSDAISR